MNMKKKIKKVICSECGYFKAVVDDEQIKRDGTVITRKTIHCLQYGDIYITGNGRTLWKTCGGYSKASAQWGSKLNKDPRCALEEWMWQNSLTVANVANLLGFSVRQTGRYLAGYPMTPEKAAIAEKKTGINKQLFVFTPKTTQSIKEVI